MEKTAHKLPHWQQGEVAIFVTFRLADSLPCNSSANPPPWDNVTETSFHGQFSEKLGFTRSILLYSENRN
jgi:hypothetical protein